MKRVVGLIGRISGASGATIIINILAYPLLMRLYSPDEYGKYSYFLYAVGIVSALSIARMELYIPTIKKKVKLREAISVSLVNLILMTLFSFLIGMGLFYLNFLDFDEGFLFLFCVFLYGLYSLSQALTLSLGFYRSYSFMIVVQALACIISQCILVVADIGYLGLVYGYILSFFIATIINMRVLKFLIGLCESVGYKNYLMFMRKNTNLWLSNCLQSVCNVGSLYVLASGVFIIGGSAQVGYFSMFQKILQIPVRLIGNSTKQVLLKEYRSENKNKLRTVSVKITLGFLFLSILLIGFLGGVGGEFAKDYLPADWAAGYIFALPISLWVSFTIVYVPAIAYLNIIGDAKPHLYYELVQLSMRLLMFLLVYYAVVEINSIDYLYVTSISSVFLILAFVYGVFRVKKNEDI